MNPSSAGTITQIDADAAAALLKEGRVQVVDVRTPDEFGALGHMPGALLLPVHLIASAPAVLARDERPVLVYCEHGIRSRQAAGFLAQAGFAQVLNLAGGLSQWRGPRDFGTAPIAGPASWLIDNTDLLRGRGRALDVACGRGRHALLLAAAGLEVTAIDRDPAPVEELSATARRLGFDLAAGVVDLEAEGAEVGDGAFDLILVVHFLHRPLFPALRRALAPGGLLLYETFTVHQAARGRPTNPDYLLQPGELASLVSPLDVVRAREGEFDGRMVSAVAAVRR